MIKPIPKSTGPDPLKTDVFVSCLFAKKWANTRITVILTNSAGCIPNIHPFAPFTALAKKAAAANNATLIP